MKRKHSSGTDNNFFELLNIPSYYIASPIMKDGWAILGEQDKFITMSKQRIDSVSVSAAGIKVMLNGVPHEKVNFSVRNPQGKVDTLICNLESSGKAVVSCHNDHCACN